jgi:putative drug exporter of the RND superfamily
VLALAAVTIGIGAIGILAGFFSVPDVGPTVAVMIGLGVGIDYCLFVLHRHRQALHEGHDIYESAGRANATSGQAVCFAGMTVVIAICGLQLSGLPAVAMLGYATALVVIVAVTAAVTLLPAFLGLVGYRVNGLLARTRRKEQDHDIDPMTTVSGRWAARVGRKPIRYAVVSFVGLSITARSRAWDWGT